MRYLILAVLAVLVYRLFRPKSQARKSRASLKWKEQMVYEENGNFLIFEAPMGVSPVSVYVPTAAAWKEKVPEWAWHKRARILEEISALPEVGSIIEEDTAWVGAGLDI